jgi:2-succinyl-6-hydroxy-2,4-cyclohexadiene-1-carboxylate synthase
MLYLHSFAPFNKKKVLFIHGFLGENQDFIPIIKMLKNHFHCLGIDLPGHGKTPWVQGLSKIELMNAIALLIKKHSIAAVVGYSLGGRLAMEIDSRFPGLIKKLVILSSHLGLEADEALQRENNIMFFKNLLHHSAQEFLYHWYKQPLFHSLCKKMILKKRKKINVEAALWMLEELSLSSQPSLWNHVYENAEKYFFICGGSDLYYKKLYAGFRNKKTLIGASHAVHIEKPKKCYQIIYKHLM